jgi:hypothetical protein
VICVNCACFTQITFTVLEKVPFCKKYSTKLLNLSGHHPTSPPCSWKPPTECLLLGKQQMDTSLCLNFFFPDLNCLSYSNFVQFVKTPLFSLCPVAVSFLLLKISKVRVALSLYSQVLLCSGACGYEPASHFCAQQTMEIISSPTNFGSMRRLQLTKEFLPQYTGWWVPTTGQSLLLALISLCKIISSLKKITFS